LAEALEQELAFGWGRELALGDGAGSETVEQAQERGPALARCWGAGCDEDGRCGLGRLG
jgi:hypothetical protein